MDNWTMNPSNLLPLLRVYYCAPFTNNYSLLITNRMYFLTQYVYTTLPQDDNFLADVLHSGD